MSPWFEDTGLLLKKILLEGKWQEYGTLKLDLHLTLSVNHNTICYSRESFFESRTRIEISKFESFLGVTKLEIIFELTKFQVMFW